MTSNWTKWNKRELIKSFPHPCLHRSGKKCSTTTTFTWHLPFVLKKHFQSSITQFLLPMRCQNLRTKSHRGSPQPQQDLYSHMYRQEGRKTEKRVYLLHAEHIHGNKTPETKGLCGVFGWVFWLLMSTRLKERGVWLFCRKLLAFAF